jgi:hypothetical protein
MAHAFLVPVAGGDPIPLVKDSVIIGRRPECDIRLEIPNVSGRHAELRLHRGAWHVIDLQSANGTKVNGDKVKKKRLAPGDEVVFARTNKFIIEFDPVAASHVAKPKIDAAGEFTDGTGWDKKLRRGRRRPERQPTAADLDAADVVEEKEPAFKKSLLEKAGLAKGGKFDADDVFDDDLDALEELEELIEEPAKPPKKPDK